MTKIILRGQNANLILKQTGRTGPQGETGPAGPQGPVGPQGPAGEGVPAGGTTGEVLTKTSNTDYDTEWAPVPSAPVDSVNGQTGVVVLDAADVGADIAGSAAQALTDANEYTDEQLEDYVAKGELVLNVKDYGAVGDGVTDDSSSIQAAIDAAAAATYKGVVYIPPGHYRLNTALVPKTGVSVKGAGMGKSILLPYGTVSAFYDITSASPAAPFEDMVFEDFEIDGSNQVGPYNVAKKGFYIWYLRRCVFRNLYIHDTVATGLGCDFFQDSTIESVIAYNCGRLNNGLQPGGSGIGVGVGELNPTLENLTITNCHALNNKRYGIFIESQDSVTEPFGTIISDNVVRGNTVGIGECGGRGTIITGNIAINNSAHGIQASTGTYPSGIPGVQTIISSNTVYNNALHGIYLWASAGETLLGYTIANNRTWNNGGKGIVALTTNTVASYINISGNSSFNNGEAAISIDLSPTGGTYKHVRIADNEAWNNGRTNVSVKSGIRITEDIEDLQVIDNRCFDDQDTKTQAEGLYIGGGAAINGGKIEGNDFRGNLTQGATLIGTLTDVDVRNNAGYNPIGTSAITVTASPFTYTAGNSPEDVYISGGTVSAIAKNGSTLFASTDKMVHLEPRQAVTVTYSAAPTMVKDVL